MPQLALYCPDIPQNVGAAIRLCACLDMPLHIIEPCGFPWNDKKIRRSAMDYIESVSLIRHQSWEAFCAYILKDGYRIILMTTKSDRPYIDFEFRDGDILLAGRESAGVPPEIHAAADARLAIPLSGRVRSLNVITACAMMAGESLKQTKWA